MIYIKGNLFDDHELKKQAIAVCLEDLGSLMKGEYPTCSKSKNTSLGCSRRLSYYVKWVKMRLQEKYACGELHDIPR